MTIDDDESIAAAEQLVDLPSRASVPFALGDSQLLEKLYSILSVHDVNAETAQEIKSSLLSVLQSNVKSSTLTSVHKMTQQCVSCPNMNHDAALPKWNRESPKALFILESPDCLTPDGKELFITSLVKNGLKSAQCGCTYVTRCTKDDAPVKDEIENCTSLYLYTEIQLMRPQVIVPLGATATKALLGPDIKLTDLTSQPQVIWLGPWAIVPQLSPNYVVNPNVNLKKEFSLIMKKVANLVSKQEENDK